MSGSGVPFVVYAVGGHARVVADALQSTHQELIGFVDDNSAKHGCTVMGLPVFGVDSLLDLALERPLQVALGIGDNTARRACHERCLSMGLTLGSVIHRAAVVSPSAVVGAGTVIFAGAIVNAEARIGEGCIVNTGAIVEHNVVVGNFAHVSPGATLAGGSRLGADSQLGAHAVIIDDVFVGARTIVGAGAVVNRTLPDDVVAYGVPARVKRPRISRTP
jgi:sugar O-acyltransferase (sialic acid O-acetyltransferase NeuD family)